MNYYTELNFVVVTVMISIVYISNIAYSQENTVNINIFEPGLEIMNQSKNSAVDNHTGFLTDVNVTDRAEYIKKSDLTP